MAEGWDPNPSVLPPPVLPNASSEMMSGVRKSFESVSLMMPDDQTAFASHGGLMATAALGSNGKKPEEDYDPEGGVSLSSLAFIPSLQPSGCCPQAGPEDAEIEGSSERNTPFLMVCP